MTLRLRLLLSIGVSLCVLWAAMAAWMLHGLDRRMSQTLDQRLAMSARMVAALMAQNPDAWSRASSTLAPVAVASPSRGIACQVSSLHGEVYARTPDTAPEGMKAARDGFGEVEMNGERWRTYAVSSPNFRVTTADRFADRDKLLRAVLLASSAPFAVALAVSLVILWFTVRRELRPLERFRLALESRAPDSLRPVEAPGMPPELRPLVGTLNDLLERAALAIGRERRFTSDAAHELRSPLTAIKTHLQVARISRGAAAAEAIDHALEGAARLQHALAQLLTLAQVEGPFSWEEGGCANAAALLERAVSEARGGRQRVRICGPVPEAALAIPPALATMALRNLLENALLYSGAESPVHVSVVLEPGAVRFRIADRGPGMDPAELEAAGGRFWRKGSGHGSGLGLSIVSAIAKRFGGSLALAPREGGGLEARLSFPLEPAAAANPGDPAKG